VVGTALLRIEAEPHRCSHALAGTIGLAAQVIFAIFPVLQVWRRFGKPLDRQNTATL
jgi:hypothetical protein